MGSNATPSAPDVPPPKAFVSYSWDDEAHKSWVQALARRLRRDGINITLDQWHVIPGDMVPAFMETAIRESDFVIIVCTPNYRLRSDARRGGVGYEGDIITGEVITEQDQRKFLPILRGGDWNSSSPSWLRGKIYIDLRDTPNFETNYWNHLVKTLHRERPTAPPIGPRPTFSHFIPAATPLPIAAPSMEWIRWGALAATIILILLGALYIWVKTDKIGSLKGESKKIHLNVSPLPLERERIIKSGASFQECDACPQMIVVPTGSFTMGSTASERGRTAGESPQPTITIARPIAVGRYSITFDEWDACFADGGCNGYRPPDQGWGRKKRPVINVSWSDASAYVSWLSKRTGKIYRLPSESEREYFSRAGTTTAFWWGNSISTEQANYNGNYSYDGGPKGQYRASTVPVDAFAANPWGFFQVHGNVQEWIEDCFQNTLEGIPTDGNPRSGAECNYRVLRGGSWYGGPEYLRAASRFGGIAGRRGSTRGFRVVRELRT